LFNNPIDRSINKGQRCYIFDKIANYFALAITACLATFLQFSIPKSHVACIYKFCKSNLYFFPENRHFLSSTLCGIFGQFDCSFSVQLLAK